MNINDKTMADIIVDLIHLSKNSNEMYRLAKQQESEINIINSENQAIIRFLGKELPNKYEKKVINEYKLFVQKNYPKEINKLDVDDKKAIANLSSNNKKISGLLGSNTSSSNGKSLLSALKKLTNKKK